MFRGGRSCGLCGPGCGCRLRRCRRRWGSVVAAGFVVVVVVRCGCVVRGALEARWAWEVVTIASGECFGWFAFRSARRSRRVVLGRS